jgi:hypothetical protein
MKRLLLLSAVLLLAANLSACARKGDKPKTPVKCPACGYQFEIPPHGR